jgi:hypothetical protein
VWPAAITTAQQPFKSNIWVAALHVIMTRDGDDLSRTRRLGGRFDATREAGHPDNTGPGMTEVPHRRGDLHRDQGPSPLGPTGRQEHVDVSRVSGPCPPERELS